MVVSLGPTSMATQLHNLPKNPKSDGTGHNPRCLRRDINRNAAMGATTELMYALLTESKDINTFYNTLLGTPPPKNTSFPWGVSLFRIHVLSGLIFSRGTLLFLISHY